MPANSAVKQWEIGNSLPLDSAILAQHQFAQAGARIRTAAEVPLSMLEAFYARMFPARAAFLAQNWRWLYRVRDSASIAWPLLAVVKGQVAGHLSAIPVTLRRDDHERTAIWLLDLAVLPEHQRQGLAGLLLSAGMSLTRLQMAFGTEQSWRILARLGWKSHFDTMAFRLLLRPNRHPRVQARGRVVKTVAKTAGMATRVVWRSRTSRRKGLSVQAATAESLMTFQQKEPGSLVHVPRSAEFLNWRIVSHPRADKHIVFSLPARRNAQYSAIAQVVDASGYRGLHLLALSGDTSDRNALFNFFASIAGWAVAEDYDHVLLVTSEPSIAQVAGWWFPISKRLRFAFHANDPQGEKFLSGAKHQWECIDSDLDLMYVA